MNFTTYITEKLQVPFCYGTNDCVLFSIGWAEIATGKKYLPAKLWKSEKEALTLLKKHGGLVAVFDKHFQQVEPNFAQDGDLTVLDGVAYLFSGAKIISVSAAGLISKNRLLVTVAWRVKHG